MFRFTRYFVAFVLLFVCCGLTLRWFLGDDFRPWVNTARLSVRHQITALVDEYSLELEKAKEAVAKAEVRAVRLRLQKQKVSASIKTLERRRMIAVQDLADTTTRLANLRDQIQAGQLIRFVGSGRVATDIELQTIVERCSGKITVAQERINYLKQIQKLHDDRHRKLVELNKLSPMAIQRLKNGVEFLAEKLALYQDVKEWVDEDQAADAEMAGLYDEAQRTLEDAHSKLDAKLAEVDAVLDFSLDLEVEPAAKAVSTDALLADIRSTLNNVAIQK